MLSFFFYLLHLPVIRRADTRARSGSMSFTPAESRRYAPDLQHDNLLPLRELESLARFLLAVFLSLDHARVPRHQSGSAQRLRCSSLIATSARAMLSRIAPAWPVDPPPSTLTRMSYFPVDWVISSGFTTSGRSVSRGKYCSSVRC